MTDNTTPPADDVSGCSSPKCPLEYAHDGPCAPEKWEPPADDVREALIEGVKLEARNLMRSDSRVWHEALESALDKTLPGFWAAATQVRPRGTVTDADGSDSMGRFAFDGAEGIAFHVYSDEEHEECLAEVMFDDMPVLVAFLRHNFPGLFS